MPDETQLPLDAHFLTMSTLEIAGLTGKRHNNVLRDARSMLEKLSLPVLSFERCYRGEDGKQHPVINLPKRECLILVSGYSVEMRARIIDRWLELEAALDGATRSAPAVIRAFDGWTPAEINARVGLVTAYRLTIGPAGGLWAMQRLGFPIPPAHMLPHSHQRELDLWPDAGHA